MMFASPFIKEVREGFEFHSFITFEGIPYEITVNLYIYYRKLNINMSFPLFVGIPYLLKSNYTKHTFLSYWEALL